MSDCSSAEEPLGGPRTFRARVLRSAARSKGAYELHLPVQTVKTWGANRRLALAASASVYRTPYADVELSQGDLRGAYKSGYFQRTRKSRWSKKHAHDSRSR